MDGESGTVFGISKLTSAVRALTENVLALAATVRDVNTGLRGRLALDGPEEAPESLGHNPKAPGGPDALPAPKRKGKVA
jgi:hypothetical protein